MAVDIWGIIAALYLRPSSGHSEEEIRNITPSPKISCSVFRLLKKVHDAAVGSDWSSGYLIGLPTVNCCWKRLLILS